MSLCLSPYVSVSHSGVPEQSEGLLQVVKETKGLTLEEIDLLWASEEYRIRNKDAQVIEDSVSGDSEHKSIAGSEATGCIAEKVV